MNEPIRCLRLLTVDWRRLLCDAGRCEGEVRFALFEAPMPWISGEPRLVCLDHVPEHWKAQARMLLLVEGVSDE